MPGPGSTSRSICPKPPNCEDGSLKVDCRLKVLNRRPRGVGTLVGFSAAYVVVPDHRGPRALKPVAIP